VVPQSRGTGIERHSVLVSLEFASGSGVPRDDAEAAKWWRRAADQGHAEAQYYLALTYKAGTGAPLNYAEAMKWDRKAADQSLVKAQFDIG
jgi:TPR repeat protein